MSTHNKNQKASAPETRTRTQRFDAKQKARRISGMTTFDAEDLKIQQSAPSEAVRALEAAQ